MRISDWSSDVCSSDLLARAAHRSVFGDDSCQGYAFKLGDRENILVTATGQVDDDAFADTESRRKLLCRSEEHTSELQSLMRISYATFCLKKKKQNTIL